MAKTGVRVGITLACTECKRRNYQTQKSKRNSPDRVEFKKYCRWCGDAHAPPGDALVARRRGRSAARAREAQAGSTAAAASRSATAHGEGAGPPGAQPTKSQPARSAASSGSFVLRRVVGRAARRSSGPARSQVIQATVVVLIACIVVGVYLYVNDLIWKHVVQRLLGQ